tara:strand:- start:25851 stop:30161 length:4311 start_codon:yes stop_codon:yes gene_type:complete
VEEIELGVESVEVEENIYENQETFSDVNQKKSLQADLAVSTISKGGDLVQAIEESATMSADEMRIKATTDHQNSERELLNGTVEHIARTDPDRLSIAVPESQAKFREIELLGESKLAPYRSWVDSLDGSEKLTSKEKDAIAVDSVLLEAITKGADKRAWYETSWDVLGMMAVPDESYNAAALQSDLFGDEVGFKEWLGSADAFYNIAEFRNQLPAEQRVMFDERLVEAVQGVDDNKLQQISAVLAVLGRDPDTIAFQGMEKAEALLVGAGLGKALFKGLRSVNVLNRTAKAGDARAVAKISDAVTSDLAIAKEAGVTQADAATVGNPVKPEGVFTGAPEGVQKMYRDYQGDVTAALEKATDVLNITARPDTKDADEIAASIKRNLSKNDDFENIVTKANLEQVDISYDVVTPDGLVSVSETRKFVIDDLGGFQQEEAGMLASGLRFATSPNTLAGADRRTFVQQAESALFAKSRTQAGLNQAVDAALKPINGNIKSLKKVDVVLKQLDGTDIEPTYHKLVNEGIGGQRLNDKEFVAVTGLRRVMDDVWYQNNVTVRREMELRGAKSIDFGDGNIQYAKPQKDANTAYNSFSSDVENQIIVDSAGETFRGMGLDALKTKYDEGQVLVKADSPDTGDWFKSSEGSVRYMLVNRDSVKSLPDVVLNRVKNYLPKLREDANYFVKANREVVVNGVKRPKQVTIAYASTEGQALRYIERLKKAATDAGEEWVEGSHVALFDREISKAARDSDVLTSGGGLMRGKRKSSELDWAGDLDEGGRTDALDSIQRYMGMTADRVSMSEWRLEARARVINEVETVPSIGSKVRGMDWGSIRAEISNASMAPQRKAKLLGMYDQTSTMSNIPTKTDQAFQGAVRAVAVALDRKGKKGESIAKYLYQMQDKSVVDIMKGITFNLTLGTFNMVQIPVQLLGASVAVSINPIAATKALPRWLMASGLDFVTNEQAASKFLNKVAKDQGLDSKTLQNDYSAWRKSGMYEAVVRGSADASSLANRLPYDAGFLRKGFTKAVEMGQTPYRMGELSNMRISFFTALEREKSLKGKSFKYDDATIGRVVSRAEQYRLNMSGANKAAFQKGIWALPTQFKQIYTKYMESVLGSHFTGKEKARLAIGQMALFGAAGVPILNHFTDGFLTNIVGLEEGDLNSEQLIAAKRGAIGWLINHELDIDALVSGRLTVSADVIEDINKSFADERTPMYKTMLGASFTSGDKILDLFGNSVLAGNMIIDEYLDDTEGLHPKTKEAAYMVGESLLAIPGSSRKWLAARYLSEGLVRKSDGTPLYSANPELRDIIARAVGFGSQESDDIYKLSQSEFNRKDRIKSLSDFYIAMLYRMDYGVREQLEGVTEASHINATVVQEMINKEDPADAEEIWSNVTSRLSKPRDFREKTLHDSLINAVGAYTNAANEMSIIKQKFIEEEKLGDN